MSWDLTSSVFSPRLVMQPLMDYVRTKKLKITIHVRRKAAVTQCLLLEKLQKQPTAKINQEPEGYLTTFLPCISLTAKIRYN